LALAALHHSFILLVFRKSPKASAVKPLT